tara:strand:+ start:67796 stop:70741 length:2946 start_codon:yes stop_codon:yes gene_type:complete
VLLNFLSFPLWAQSSSDKRAYSIQERLELLNQKSRQLTDFKTKSATNLPQLDFFTEIKTTKNISGIIDLPYDDNPQNLGDINGDGSTDFMISRTIRDYRTESLIDNVVKNVVFLGNTFYEEYIFYDQIIPIGDINGDGYDDAMIGINTTSTTLNTATPAIHFGGENPYSESVSLTDFEDILTGGFRIRHFDINSDGFEDMLIIKFGEFSSQIHISIIKGNSAFDESYLESEESRESFSTELTFMDELPSINEGYDFAFSKGKMASDSLNLYIANAQELANIILFYGESGLQESNQEYLTLDDNGFIGPYGFDIQLFDYNGDGNVEVLATSDRKNVALIYEHMPQSSHLDIYPRINYEQGSAHVIGDINGDGFDDLFVHDDLFFNVEGDQEGIYLHLGSNSFSLDNGFPANESIALSEDFNWKSGFSGDPYDINGDSLADFILGYTDEETNSSGLAILKGGENEPYTYQRIIDESQDNHFKEYQSFTNIGDFNGDGETDIAYISYRDGLGIYFSANGVISDSPDVVLKNLFNNDIPLTTYSGDFNGDGLSDIGVGTSTGSEIGLIFGTSIVDEATILTLEINTDDFPYQTYDTFFGDLDGDGKDELMLVCEKTEDESMNLLILKGGDEYLLENFQILKISDLTAQGFFGGIPQHIEDINGDGLSDILINDNAGTNQSYIIYGNEDWSALKVDLAFDTFQFSFEEENYLLGSENLQAIIDFNDDGLKDLSSIPLFSFDGSINSLFVWFTGSEMDGEVDLSIPLTNTYEVEGDYEFLTYELFAVDTLSENGKSKISYSLLFEDENKMIIGTYESGSDHILLKKELVPPEESIGILSASYHIPKRSIKYVNDEDKIAYTFWIPQNDNNEAITSTRLYGFNSDSIPITISNDDSDSEIIESFRLSQNYPNPFNPSTNIEFSIPSASAVNLSVFNIWGQKVATLVNRVLPSGLHEITFDASALASGVYIYRVQANGYTSTKKMLLIK